MFLLLVEELFRLVVYTRLFDVKEWIDVGLEVNEWFKFIIFVVKFEGLLKRGLLLLFSLLVLFMLFVLDDGDFRLFCRVNVVLGLGSIEEDFIFLVLGVEVDLLFVLVLNNLKEK